MTHRVKCPGCYSRQTYYRRRTKDYACMSCPMIFKKGTPISSPEKTPKTHAMHPNKEAIK
jgi:ribosomal protein L37AE/L43A